MLNNIFQSLEDHYPEMIKIRRNLHRYPELSFQEKETPRMIANYLRQLGIEVKEGVGGNGVVGRIRGNQRGSTVALRADFDALPIQDEKEVDYKSQIPGVMHACGHDLHSAALLVTAKILQKHREHLSGDVVLIHQFAEEQYPGGAQSMIQDGCLDGVDVIYGAHIWTPAPYGELWLNDGPITANTDQINICIRGKGGHGAEPHLTVDAIVTGCQLVTNLQQIVSRNIDPSKPAVLSIGSIHSGKAHNAISGFLEMDGTVRSLDQETRELMKQQISRIALATCEGSGATADVTYTEGYPSLYNDPEATAIVESVATHLYPTDKIKRIPPLMVGEDFAYYTQSIPGSFFFIGAGNHELNAIYPHHHPKFDADERAMLLSAKMFASLLFHES